MSELAGRAEQIGARLVGHALGATASKFDTNGRQSAVDFMLEWPNGRRGALEVTLVTQPASAGLALHGEGRQASSGCVAVARLPSMDAKSR